MLAEKAARLHTAGPFLSFHFRVGVRLALKILAPVLGVFFFVYYFLRWEFFLRVALIVFAESGPVESGVILFALVLPAALSSSPRVLSGLGGWMRSLPAHGRVHRRLAALAVYISEFPVLFVLSIFAAFALKGQGTAIAVRLSGLFILGWAVAGFVLPVENGILFRIFSGLAGVMAASGEPGLLASALLFVLAADALSGDLLIKKAGKKLHESRRLRFFAARVALRSLRFRLILPYLAAIPVLAASILFLKNNRFSPEVASATLRAVSSLGLAVFFAFLSHLLRLRRPVWPWARSLPCSSRQKVLQDSAFQFLLAFPMFVFVGIMNPASAWAVVCGSLFLAFRAVTAMRETTDARLGAGGKIMGEGALLSLLLGLVPWSWALMLISTPAAVLFAERADRTQKAGRWEERRHLSAGDSMSWSDR
jgi:hypothetical protein